MTARCDSLFAKPVYRVGYECPTCGEHHTLETTRRGFQYTRCQRFPALGWIRLEGEEAR